MESRPVASPLAIALALACLWGQPALAEPGLSFSGYGTLGVVRSDNDRADYLVDPFRPNGPGRSHEWTAAVDSRLGAQLSGTFTPGLSGVVQVLLQQRYDDTYRPVVEWANLKYQLTPEFSVRAGRVVLPIFMVTDSRRVGFGNPWVRTPVEVYSMVPVTSTDGAEASYRFALGNTIDTVVVTTGRSLSRFPATADSASGTANARRLVGIVNTVEHGFATLRLSYGRASLTVDALDPLFDAFRQFGPPGADIADRYDVRNRMVDFTGVGASYDPGAWFAMGEWARFDTRSVLGSRGAWYVSAGRRFGSVTPYVTYASTRSESASTDPGLGLAGLPPQLAPVAAGLNAALNAQLGSVAAQKTVSVGMRWDFVRNAALKLQYDEVRPQAPSHGTFGHLEPGNAPGARTRLFSAVVDFVF